MKKTPILLLTTCTLLSLSLNAGAAAQSTKRQAHLAWLAQAKDTHDKRPCIEQPKHESTEMIQHEEETFRSIQERTLVNPG